MHKFSNNKWIWLAARSAAILILLVLAFVFLFSVRINKGNNMNPNLKDGELCLVYRMKNINRNDAVYYRKNRNEGFSRVVAMEGDSITIEGKILYVNGIEKKRYYDVSGSIQNHIVKKGCAFLVNDMNGADSRKFGDVSLDDIEGKISASMKVRGF